MAIGTTAAIIGSAVIGAGASYMSGKSSSKAIGAASDAQAAATREATKLQREARNQNVAIQQPFLNTGMAAMGQYNALLGLQVPTAAPAAPAAQQPGQIPPLGGNNPPNGMQTSNADIEAMLNSGSLVGRFAAMRAAVRNRENQQALPTQQPTTPATPPVDPAIAANAAYDRFKQYTGYTTRLAEGNNAINAGYAANGTLQSGAAMQALQEHGQQFASNEFGQYMGLLGGQQQIGVGAANALSGVNTNYANNAGNLAINQGNNLANGYIAQANNTNGMIQGIGGALAGGLGALSSYR